MGYTNKDKRYVTVGRKEKRAVARLRRLAYRREDQGLHPRNTAVKATRRGWWYA